MKVFGVIALAAALLFGPLTPAVPAEHNAIVAATTNCATKDYFPYN